MTIVEATRSVTGGVDTHLDVHVAAVLDEVGRLLDTASFPVSSTGYECLFNWLEGFGAIARVGMEGTGAYGAGLARYLQSCGVQVIEVDRPNRGERRRSGKSDTIDAIEAARAALCGRARSLAKRKDGGVEAIRALLVAKRSGRRARTQALIQMRNLVVSSPEELHDRLTGLTIYRLVSACSRLRPDRSSNPVVVMTKTALVLLAHRVQALQEELERLERLLTELVEQVAPDLLCRFGVGPDTAAALLVTAGDNPERLRSESAFAHLCGVAPIPASSGKTSGRVRLDQGGDRQANAALWRIVMVRIAHDPRTTEYFERRVSEGCSKRDVIRILKRYVARELYRYLPRG
ncbi:MAG: IS110 family transposase [Acidimicrobiales bacterium]